MFFRATATLLRTFSPHMSAIKALEQLGSHEQARAEYHELLADAKRWQSDAVVAQQQAFLIQRTGLQGHKASSKGLASFWSSKSPASPQERDVKSGRLLKAAPTSEQLEELQRRAAASDSRHIRELQQRRAADLQPLPKGQRRMSTFGVKILEALGEDVAGSPSSTNAAGQSPILRFGPLVMAHVDFEQLGFVREVGARYVVSLSCAALAELQSSFPWVRTHRNATPKPWPQPSSGTPELQPWSWRTELCLSFL